MRLLLIPLLLLAGCTLPPEPMTAPAADKSAQIESEPIPLLVLAGQLARYEMIALPADELTTFSSAYPDTGATVDRFIWETRIVIPAYGLPAEACAGLSSMMRLYLPAALRDSFTVRTACIDSSGNVGEWSEIGGFEQ